MTSTAHTMTHFHSPPQFIKRATDIHFYDASLRLNPALYREDITIKDEVRKRPGMTLRQYAVMITRLSLSEEPQEE